MERIKEVNIALIEAEFLMDFEKCTAWKATEIAETEAKARIEVAEYEDYKKLLEKQALELAELVEAYVRSKCTEVEEKYQLMLDIYEKYIIEKDVMVDTFIDMNEGNPSAVTY